MDKNGWTAFDGAELEKGACLYGCILLWHVYRGAVSEAWEARRATPMYTHWMAMPRRGWIASAQRLPTAEDGDVQNCVLARHAFDGIQVTGWRRFHHDTALTHWMRMPDPPKEAEKYKERFL